MNTLLLKTADLKERRCAPGEVLLHEEEKSGTLAVLVEGEVEVVRGGVRLAVVSEPGALFGEIAALLGTPHMATVRAVTPCRVRSVPEVRAFFRAHPDACREAATTLAWRLVDTSNFLADQRKEFMNLALETQIVTPEETQEIEAFRGYWKESDKIFERQRYTDSGIVDESLEFEQFMPDEEVLTQSAQSPRAYILRTGSVEIVKNGYPLFMLWDKGAVFGEISAILGTGHTATVRALEPSTFQVLKNVPKFFAERPETSWFMATLLAKRLLDTNKYFVILRKQFERLTARFQGTKSSRLRELLSGAEKTLYLRQIPKAQNAGGSV